MDKVRFGRALGYGTRQAAKTLAAVAEAASAPDPEAKQERVAPAPSALERATPRASAAGRHATSLGRSVWKPLATFTGVLWLQVTGTFFALIATTFGLATWRLYSVAGPNRSPVQRNHLLVFAAVCLLFVYFAASSFVRAQRRGR